MQEFELKFQVPWPQRSALEAALRQRGATRRVRLQAAYFDTPGRELAQAGLALRLRKEGRHWVQTLKAAETDAWRRFEHDVRLRSMPPMVDPTRHAGTPPGDRLLALVRRAGPLAETYRTEVWRRACRIEHRLGHVELAFDLGEIRSGERRWPVCEFEIELLDGAPEAVLEVAEHWMAHFGLWLDIRSKAERGDRLAKGLLSVPATSARAVTLPRRATLAQAWQAVLTAIWAHVGPNVCELAQDDPQAADHRVEQVHQARVALRRLRTALRFFDGWPGVPDTAAAQDAARAVFARLGLTRDRDVAAALLAPVWAAAGVSPPESAMRMPAGSDGVAEALRSAEAQRLWLQLLRWRLAGPGPGGEVPFAPLATKRLRSWHRAVVAQAAGFSAMDDAQRHALRKRIKRLRYAVDFAADLYEAGAVKGYRRALAAAQDCLGQLHDAAIAGARLADVDASWAWYARGWLTARREALWPVCQASLASLAEAPRFWKTLRGKRPG
ncbi:MAG: CHAD domain-containing protein [Caldimonas manganoxidans]|nr:CHAD domain-containing protein [Caldimonas manganoxidans]